MAVDVYATAEQLKATVNLEGDVANEGLLDLALKASTRAVNIHCGRRFWQDSTVQTRTYRCDNPTIAWVDDISTTEGLIIRTGNAADGWSTTLTADVDYELGPDNVGEFAAGDEETPARAWWRIEAIAGTTLPVSSRRSLQVTAKFGWSAVPEDVTEATLIKAAKLFKRKDSPLGSVGFDQFGVRISRYEDPDVVMLLEPLRRIHMAAV